MALVLLPCEIYHREFDSKCILAAKLASEKGCNVLIGYDKFFNVLIPHLPKALLLDKSCSSVMYYQRILPVKKKGGIVLVNDEEGFNDITTNYTSSWLNRVDPNCARDIDLYLAWGQTDKLFFEQIIDLKSKISIAGNCRSDLLGSIGKIYYKDCISSYSNMFGDFALVSDNFCVERWNPDYHLPKFDISNVKAKEAEAEFSTYEKVAACNRDHFCDILEPVILKNPSTNFVLRPHPVANPLWWNKRFNQFRNLYVIYQNSVEPWIHSCRSIVTMGCTTAIQAVIAQKNVIDIEPSPEYCNVDKPFISRFIDQSICSSHALNSCLFGRNGFSITHDKQNYLSDQWANLHLSSTSLFAEIISDYARQLGNLDHDRLNLVLDKTHSSKMPPLNNEKWPYPSFSQLSQRLNHLYRFVLNKRPFMVKEVIPGLYLLSPPSK